MAEAVAVGSEAGSGFVVATDAISLSKILSLSRALLPCTVYCAPLVYVCVYL